jgi:hypothetical protein
MGWYLNSDSFDSATFILCVFYKPNYYESNRVAENHIWKSWLTDFDKVNTSVITTQVKKQKFTISWRGREASLSLSFSKTKRCPEAVSNHFFAFLFWF